MSKTKTHPSNDSDPDRSIEISRRGIIKTAGLGAGAAIAPGAASRAGVSPVGGADAQLVGGGSGFSGGFVGLFTNLGSTTGDSNSTAADAIFRDFFQDIQAQEKRAKETIGLTFDILDRAREYWFSRAKLKAIESINLGKSKSEVVADAKAPVISEIKQYQKNMIQINDDLVTTINNYYQLLIDNGYDDQVIYVGSSSSGSYRAPSEPIVKTNATHTRSLVDGSSVTVLGNTEDEYESYNLFDRIYRHAATNYLAIHPDNAGYDYKQFTLQLGDLKRFADGPFGYGSSSQNILQEVADYWDDGSAGLKYEIETWVNNAYDAVASGDIDPAALNDAGTLYQQLSEDQDTPLATASLRLLNIPSDANNLATLKIGTTNSDYTVTVENAVLGATGGATVGAGDTIDPSTSTSEWIANYNATDIAVDATPIAQTQIDGGTLTLSKVAGSARKASESQDLERIRKYLGEDFVYQVSTNKDETVQFTNSDLSYDSNNDNWTVDLSGDLENPIAEISGLKIYSQAGDTNSQAYINQQFTVESFENQETGESVTSVDFTQDNREPHTTDNYLTKDEWETREAELQEQIDEIRDLGGGSSSGGGFAVPSAPGFGILSGLSDAARWAVYGLGGLILLRLIPDS